MTAQSILCFEGLFEIQCAFEKMYNLLKIICVLTYICFATPLLSEQSTSPFDKALSIDRIFKARMPRSQLHTISATLNTRNAKIYSREQLAKVPFVKGGKNWECLANAIYFEARGETIKGQYAVAEVILNRVASRAYPNNVCAVVSQGSARRNACQFSFMCDGKAEYIREPKAFSQSGKIARIMLNGATRELTKGALFYHAKSVSPSWIKKMRRIATVGYHHFYTAQK